MRRTPCAWWMLLCACSAPPGQDDPMPPETDGQDVDTGTANDDDDDDDDTTAGEGTTEDDGDDDDDDDTTGGPVDDPASWTPPIGIPVPPFGILETVEDACAACDVITTSDLADLQNIPAGTVIQLEGGPFEGGQLEISGQGTADAPVFVRSAEPDTPVTLTYDVRIEGSHLIVEHIDFDQGLADKSVSVSGDHIGFRHNTVHAFRPGHFSTTLYVSNASDVVIYDSEIHDNGDFDIAGEHDVHGIGGGALQRLWIVDNHLHHNRGDSMQFGHQAGNTLGDIYVGRNDIHDDGENCVDIKEASRVVVSENDLHDPGAGIAVVFHDCPIAAAAIYNEFHDTPIGISLPSLEDACAPFTPIDLFVVRNELTALQTGIQGWGSGKRYLISGNGFSQTGSPIDVDNAGPGSILETDDTDLATVFAAFEAEYGIAIDDP